MYVKSLVLIFLNISISFAQITQIISLLNDTASNCRPVKTKVKFAVSGWPFKLNCDDILQNPISSTSFQCYSSSDSFQTVFLSSETTFMTNETDVTTFHVAAVFNETYCLRGEILVKTLPLYNESSSYDAIQNDVKNNRSVENFSIDFGNTLNLLCIPTSASDLSQLLLPSNIQTTWWRSRLSPNHTYENTSFGFRNYSHLLITSFQGAIVKSPGGTHGIQIYETKFNHPGLYSCELLYQGQRTLIVHASVCVNTLINVDEPNVGCNKEISFFQNQDAVIDCPVQTSNVQIDSGGLIVKWSNEDYPSAICENNFDVNSNVIESENLEYSCSIQNFSNLPGLCISSPGDQYKELSNKKAFNIRLSIKNIEKSQAGIYHVRLYYNGEWSEVKSINLKFNPERELRRIASILAIVLGLIAAVILGLFCVWWQWVQILLFVRRHIGKYDEDSKEFVAIFSYVYSLDLPEDTRNTTKKIVQCIQEKMTELNYRFYDSHKDFNQGSTVSNLLKYLDESHRMIVILTDAYVAERWSRFEAQQGFFNMLKNRTKLIFVRTPGAKQALNKCKRKGDDFAKELDEAMKASRNIYWHSKMSDTRFKDHVQYALPNLKRFTETSVVKYQKVDQNKQFSTKQTDVFISSGSLTDLSQNLNINSTSMVEI